MGAEASLGAIVRAKGGELLSRFPVNAAQRKVMRAMADCRSAALGGHRDRCDSCGYEHVFWNSCRDRHCPGCGGQARERWLDARRDEVLDVPYFHVVFTIPDILNVLALHAPEVIYAILLRCAGQALLDLGASRLGARMGILAVLHTWGQTLVFHPHIHCVVPGGGFSLDGRRWVRVPKIDFLFAVKALSRRFRTLFRNAVREAYAGGTLQIPAELDADAQALDLLFARSYKTDWHAYVKPPLRWSRACARVSSQLHAPHRHLQSAHPLVRWTDRHLLLARLCRSQRGKDHGPSRPPSSCAASSSTSSHRALHAFGITASSPTATAPSMSQKRAS